MKKVNRFISPILAFLCFPILYFAPLLNIFISSGLLSNDDGTKVNILSKYLELRQYMSISFLVDFLKEEDHTKLFNTIIDAIKDSGSSGSIKEIITSLDWIYVTLVFFALLIVLLIALIVFAAIGKFTKTTTCLSAGAVVSVFGMNFSFDMFAKPFLDGSINVSTIISNFTSGTSGEDSTTSLTSILGTLSGLVNKVASVDAMELSVAYNFTLFVLIIVFVLCFCTVFAKKEK